MPVGVDETGHNDGIDGVDHLGSAGTHIEPDFDDPVAFDQDVCFRVVLGPGAEGQDTSPFEQGLCAQMALLESIDLLTVS
jgi:hypothetical protein